MEEGSLDRRIVKGVGMQGNGGISGIMCNYCRLIILVVNQGTFLAFVRGGSPLKIFVDCLFICAVNFLKFLSGRLYLLCHLLSLHPDIHTHTDTHTDRLLSSCHGFELPHTAK